MRNITYIFICLLFVACSQHEELGVVTKPLTKPVEVAISVAQGGNTRTSMDEVGSGDEGSSQSIRWSIGDKIMVWAKEQGTDSYTVDNQQFIFATYNSTYDDADFLATLSTPMDVDKTYDYYGLYPAPASVISDSNNPNSRPVTYVLPATQNGEYNPSLDVMVASASGCGLYERTGNQNVEVGSEMPPTLNFNHLFHLIRIRIPEGQNLMGHPIKRFEITFPQPVVGQVTFDATAVGNANFDIKNATWTNRSNKITVTLDDDNLIDANKGYIWLHVMPTTLDGDVTFAAYSESGLKSLDKTFSLSDRELLPQHITPISLPISEPFRPVVYIDLNEKESYLGEAWNTMTLTGLNFVDPNTDASVTSLTITPSTKRIAVYPTIDSNYNADMSSVNGKTLTVTYDSQHALLTGKTISLPSSLQVATEYSTPINTVNYTVPYLFEENFNNAKDYDYFSTTNENGVAQSVEKAVDMGPRAGLIGWSGAKWETKNDYLIVGSYYYTVTDWGSTVTGRVDTSQLQLKENSNVTVTVSYDVKGWDKADNGISGCLFGVTNTAGLINGTNSWKNPATPERVIQDIKGVEILTLTDQSSEPSTYMSRTHTISGCSSTTRLTWCCSLVRKSGNVGGRQFYMAIDNIKVSIGSEVKGM